MADPTTVTALPLCGLKSTPLALANGFTVCSGTPGDGVSAGPVPNAETATSKLFIASYNTGADDACISLGIPDAQGNAWNTVAYTTAQGCCSTDASWASAKLKPAATNAARRTRLTPFTTASALGANDSAGMDAGMPDELVALKKVWGLSPNNWVHGGVHPDNVGLWRAAPGTSFTVKWGSATWQQASMLWSRQTGDDYAADADPYGATNPAPIGLFFTKTKPAANLACLGCSVGTGQVMGSGSGSGGSADGSAACEDPFKQVCGDTDSLPTDTTQVPWVAYPQPAPHEDKTFPGFTNTTLPFKPPAGVSDKNGYANARGRVGGVFATQSMYGPGKFSVLANLPPTGVTSPTSPIVQAGYPGVNPKTGAYPYTGADALPGGRGYVFALWTFAYTEAYAPAKDNTDWPYSMGTATKCPESMDGSSCGPKPGAYPAEMLNGEALVNASRTYPDIPGLVQGTTDGGTYATHNHEIDIEIPANSAEFQGAAMMDNLGLNTANFNTWQTDDNSYTQGALALYQQAQCTAPAGKFFCAVAPEDDQDTFHEYTFVWYVDPASADASIDASGQATMTDNSYVAFYLDGVEAYRVKRFVPRRSGRVLIGLWPAWWGSNYYPMDFNQVYCKIARMEFVPQGRYDNSTIPMLVTNGGQMYDQMTPTTGADLACGIGMLTSRQATIIAGDGGALPPSVAPLPVPPAAGPKPAPAPGPKAGLPVWAIVLIVIGVLAVMGGIGGGLYYAHTKGKLDLSAFNPDKL